MKKSHGKLSSLQILRALAAWAVVFHHYMQLYFGFKSESALGTAFSKYGSLGVDVFFVLSGFVMYLVTARSGREPARFLVNRVCRITPAYWFYCAVIVACIHFFPRGFAYTDYTLKTLIASALFLPSSNPSGLGVFPVLTVGWTLNFEMFFYISLACCMVVSSRHFLKILFFVFAILPLAYPNGTFLSQVAGSVKLYEFLAGALLAVIWTGRAGAAVRKHHVVSLIVSCGCILAGVALLMLRESTLVIALSIVAFALNCERHLQPESRSVQALVKLGDESYSTYLCHCIVIGIAIHFTGKDLSEGSQLAALLGITIGIYLMSSLSYRWLENGRRLESMRVFLIRRVGMKSVAAESV